MEKKEKLSDNTLRKLNESLDLAEKKISFFYSKEEVNNYITNNKNKEISKRVIDLILTNIKNCCIFCYIDNNNDVEIIKIIEKSLDKFEFSDIDLFYLYLFYRRSYNEMELFLNEVLKSRKSKEEFQEILLTNINELKSDNDIKSKKIEKIDFNNYKIIEDIFEKIINDKRLSEYSGLYYFTNYINMNKNLEDREYIIETILEGLNLDKHILTFFIENKIGLNIEKIIFDEKYIIFNLGESSIILEKNIDRKKIKCNLIKKNNITLREARVQVLEYNFNRKFFRSLGKNGFLVKYKKITNFEYLLLFFLIVLVAYFSYFIILKYL